MSTITIHNQNLLDIAVQEYGDARAVIELAFNNDVNVTDVLPVGGALNIMDSTYSDSDVLGYYKRKSIKPATAEPLVTLEDVLEGVGYWAIEDNFIVQ
jgi:hypothetical protein